MERNPAISQNNDLIIMLLAGIAMYISQTYLVEWTFDRQLLVLGGFLFVSGLFMNRGSQLFEWFLFFAFGGLMATLFDVAYAMYPTGEFPLPLFIEPLIQTGTWYFYFLISFMIAVPLGSLVNRMLVGNYWYRKTLYFSH